MVSISTTTPQISLANDTTNYSMNILTTDLRVQCDVSAVAALDTETLTHSIQWSVDGLQAAPDAYLYLTLPDVNGDGVADVTLGTVTPGIAVPYYNSAPTLSPPPFDPNDPTDNNWQIGPPQGNHVVFLLSYRNPGESGSIAYTVTVNSGTAGQKLCTSVMGHRKRRDALCANDSCSVCTVVGTLNVYVQNQPGLRASRRTGGVQDYLWQQRQYAGQQRRPH